MDRRFFRFLPAMGSMSPRLVVIDGGSRLTISLKATFSFKNLIRVGISPAETIK